MGNRATPSRSFNTVKHSNRDKRIKRHRQERVVLLSICLVVIAILLTLAVFLVCSIVDAVKSNQPEKPNNGSDTGTNTPPSQDVTYISVTQANSAVYTGSLLVVNKDHAYQFPTTTTDLKNIYENRLKYDGVSNTYMINGNSTTWKLNVDALNALNNMMYKYYELFRDGSTSISSAYRSYEDQEKLGSSVKAGYSDHHTGYCVALMTNGGNSYLENDHWIYENCYKYGFIVRYPDSKSSSTGVSGYEHCFRYVGVAHATYIYQNNLCFEEYVELLKSTYTANNHLQVTGADGNRYEVYYVPASSTDTNGITTIQVPKNCQYSISGDNIGGFIVTVNLDAPISE